MSAHPSNVRQILHVSWGSPPSGAPGRLVAVFNARAMQEDLATITDASYRSLLRSAWETAATGTISPSTRRDLAPPRARTASWWSFLFWNVFTRAQTSRAWLPHAGLVCTCVDKRPDMDITTKATGVPPKSTAPPVKA
jgi:hypothetical protein